MFQQLTPDEEGYVYSPLPPGTEVVEKDGAQVMRFKPEDLQPIGTATASPNRPLPSDAWGKAEDWVEDVRQANMPHGLTEEEAKAEREKWREKRRVRLTEELAAIDDEDASFPRLVRIWSREQPQFGRATKEPLYDHGILEAGKQMTTFFVSTRQKGLARSNVLGNYGTLPSGHHFYWWKIALVPDLSASKEALQQLWETGVLEFKFASSTLCYWPCRALMAPPQDLLAAAEEGTFPDVLEHAASVTVEGRPVEIVALEAWQVNLFTPEPVKEDVGLMPILFGVQVKAG